MTVCTYIYIGWFLQMIGKKSDSYKSDISDNKSYKSDINKSDKNLTIIQSAGRHWCWVSFDGPQRQDSESSSGVWRGCLLLAKLSFLYRRRSNKQKIIKWELGFNILFEVFLHHNNNNNNNKYNNYNRCHYTAINYYYYYYFYYFTH